MGQVLSFVQNNYARLFSFVKVDVPAWLLMMFAPYWKHTNTIVLATSFFWSALYTAVLASMATLPKRVTPLGLLLVKNLKDCQDLLATESGAVLGWFHFMAFDLLVGMWEVANAKDWGVPRAAMVPCLGMSMACGPAGMLTYLGTRAILGKPPKAN